MVHTTTTKLHSHLKSRNRLVTGRTSSSSAKQSVKKILGIECILELQRRHLPQVVTFAENKISLGKKSRAHLPQTTIATGTFETVFVPQLVKGFQ